MTSPVPAGSPDWNQNYSPSNIVVSNFSGTINNNQIDGPFYVGSMPYVTLDALCPGAGMLISLGWFSDAAATVSIGADTIETQTNIPARATFPVIGPYCSISYGLTVGSAIVQGSLTMSASPSTHATGSDGILFSAYGTALGAGVAATLDAPRVRQGFATFSAATGVAAGFLELYSLSYTGTPTFMAETSLAAIRRPFQFHLPPRRLRVIVRNTGAATIYNLGVTVDPTPR